MFVGNVHEGLHKSHRLRSHKLTATLIDFIKSETFVDSYEQAVSSDIQLIAEFFHQNIKHKTKTVILNAMALNSIRVRKTKPEVALSYKNTKSTKISNLSLPESR
jgi:hypothetical protein